jgi:hypothetical protein
MRLAGVVTLFVAGVLLSVVLSVFANAWVMGKTVESMVLDPGQSKEEAKRVSTECSRANGLPVLLMDTGQGCAAKLAR